MKHTGWLLDAYIRGDDAIYWIKTGDGETLKLMTRHHPQFLAEPAQHVTPEDLTSLFENHPQVYTAKVVERHPTLRRESLRKVVEVTVDKPDDLGPMLKYAERLRDVKTLYNTGLTPIQWHLIHMDTPPTSLCTVEETRGRIRRITRLDDSHSLEPPPFKALEFTIPDTTTINQITVLDDQGRPTASLKGEEPKVLSDLQSLIQLHDPDILVTPTPINTSRHLQDRARRSSQRLRLGRGDERLSGRVLVSSGSFHDMGVAGLAERARFTYAPMGVSHSWEAGKTIDSRQCAEAVKFNVLVPPMRGGYAYSAWAWDLIRRDKGGMVFSPRPGLHMNVAALDFESMYPNIIVRRNVSYETVTEDGVDHSIDGFLGRVTKPFLERRLTFKHMRARYPEGSVEWQWCQQRQSTLKLFLVVIYGYSGCYANRFANTRVFQEINRQARDAMVTALNVAQGQGYQVVYGPYDSLFVKKRNAERTDYMDLAAMVSEATGLPMALDRHFRYLVLLTKATDPAAVAVNRYYGKLTDGSLFYRGVELRRHDTPPLIRRMQMEMMGALFDAEDLGEVLGAGVAEAQRIAGEAMRRIRRGGVDPQELVVSRRLRRDPGEYRSRQPHVVAAMLGGMEEMSRYILVNTERLNPYLRVMPESMIDGGHLAYDRRKYEAMARRAAWNLLRPFVKDETLIGGGVARESRLDTFF